MKRVVVLIVCLIFFIFTSLTNYNDLDKLLLSTSIIVDKIDNGNYSIYIEAFTPTTSTFGTIKEGQRTIIHIEGNSIADLINDLNSQSNYKLNFTHNKVILFTEKAARYGIDNILDCFSRPEEFLIRSYVAIISGDAEKIYTLKLNGEKFLGLYIIKQVATAKALIGNTSDITLSELDNQSSTGNKTCIIPIIKIIQTPSGDNLNFKSSGILKDYKLVGELNTPETIYANFLLGRIFTTIIDADNPSSESKTMALRVIKTKTRTKYSYSNSEFQILKDITIHTTARGSFGKIRLTEANIKKIEESASLKLQNGCDMVFNANKEKNIDVLNVQENFYRNYPKYSNLNILNNTELQIKVKVILNLSTDPKDFDY